MKINEEKLTAYALNELPEAERRSIEAELKNNPEAFKALEEIRAMGKKLEAHYAAEEKMVLTDEQHETIRKAARKKQTAKIIQFPRYVWVPLASAAALAGIVFFHMPTIVDETSAPLVGQASCIQEPVNALAKDTPSRIREGRPTMPTEKPSLTLVADSEMELKKLRVKSDQREEAIILPDMSGMGKGLSGSIGGFCMMAPQKKENQFPAPISPSIENYAEIRENVFQRVENQPLSTFSIDVDTASYSNVRRFLKGGSRPPKDAVRIEEMINYFNYNYAPPTDNTPFATHLEVSSNPWNPSHKLVRIGLKGRVIERDVRPPLNLVFLLDVSGSMNSENKLPLVTRSLTMLTQQMDERDRVSIVVYAGASGLVLPPTAGNNKQAIIDALKRLKAGGGTNGGQGIELAYKTALENFDEEGVNRVILCTDGDFNIGVTQGGDLNRMIEEKAKGGVFLSVLGFGTGNVKDSTMEQLADRGNGNYAYIDTFSEARKVLVDQMSGTLITIAKDVKIQVEFNPALVAGYRLIGYENRMLKTEDFNDDKKDAGEIGAGHTVTALYEIVPVGQPVNDVPPVDDLKYQTPDSNTVPSEDLLTVKLRFKQPDSDTSRKIEFPLKNENGSFENASDDFRFATSVAGFGMLLRDSEFKGDLTYEQILGWATDTQGNDEFGYRREFIDLVRNAEALTH